MIKIISGILVPTAEHRSSGEAVISLIDGQLLSSVDAEFQELVSQGPEEFAGTPNVSLGVRSATWDDMFSTDGFPTDFDSTYTRVFLLDDDIRSEDGNAVAYKVNWSTSLTDPGALASFGGISVLIMGFGRSEFRVPPGLLRIGLTSAIRLRLQAENARKRRAGRKGRKKGKKE